MKIIEHDNSEGSKIILYSTGCPKCKILKRKLDDKNIQYQVNDSVEKMLSLGITQLPVLDNDGAMMDFKSAVDWVNKQ